MYLVVRSIQSIIKINTRNVVSLKKIKQKSDRNIRLKFIMQYRTEGRYDLDRVFYNRRLYYYIEVLD